jgi:4-hydroxybutyrate CoA-transferase
MNWKDKYKERLITADEAVAHIKSGDTVVLSHAVNEPKALVDAMTANYKNYENVTVSHMISLGEGRYSKPDMKDHFRYVGWFSDKATRASIHEGQGDFVPVFFHEIPDYIRRGILKIDVAMIMVSPPDEQGVCCLGVSCDYTVQAIKSADVVIAQVNEAIPKVRGEAFVRVDEIDYFVEASHPLPEFTPPPLRDVDLKIGEYCASLIDDGSTLQLGMGTIPNAVLESLRDKKNLGIHSEMISDGVVELVEKGIINGAEKTIDNGKIVVTFLYGTKKLYDFVDDNPLIELRTVDYTNHPMVVMKNAKMVCINSAIQVDLWGQIVAGSIGKKVFSGVGGQVDFVRGANMSEDKQGKSIIAMPSITEKKDGSRISKVVANLDEGAIVTTSQNDVDYVVTEYGVAALKGKTVKDRARCIIGIAHPDFRDELIQEFEVRFNEKF